MQPGFPVPSPEMVAVRGDWMTTYSGQPFFPLMPRAEEIHIADIAHALAHLCRFAGHTIRFYSVAQHSVLVSAACEPADALWGLLHDASEAYVVDLPRPLKHALPLAGYQEVERGVMAAICERFALPVDPPASVKRADDDVLRREQIDLIAMPDGYTHRPTTIETRIDPMPPYVAERTFLQRFHQLMAERG